MGYLPERDYEEYQRRRKTERTTGTPRPPAPPVDPWQAARMPDVGVSVPQGPVIPMPRAWAPTVPSGYVPPMPEPAPEPTSRPHLPLPFPVRPPEPPQTTDGYMWRAGNEPVIQASRPFSEDVMNRDLPNVPSPVDIGMAGLEGANRFIFEPVSGLVTEAAQTEEMERRAFPRAANIPPRTGLEEGPLQWWQGLGERQMARREAGVPSLPLGDVLPFTPGEFRTVGREIARGARQLADVATSPEGQAALRRVVPAASIQPIAQAPKAAEAVPTRRFYHGTGSTFDAPDAAKFDPDGLMGPGYYLTSSPEVAGSYAEKGKTLAGMDTIDIDRARQLADAYERTNPALAAQYRAKADALEAATTRQGGPQIRAVSVPRNLPLYPANDLPVGQDVMAAIANALPEGQRASFEIRANNLRWATPRGTVTGEQLYDLLADVANSKANANQTLGKAGFDGLSYPGGRHMPLLDAQGRAIEHEALVIFPESLPKITNAISGTVGGSAPEVGAGLVGAATQYDPDKSPEQNARDMALGFGAGAAGMAGVRAGARQLAKPEVRAAIRRGIREGEEGAVGVPGEGGPAKQPWEMTRAEFEATAEPLYHGTSRQFERFGEGDRVLDRYGRPAQTERFYFTEQDQTARTFANTGGYHQVDADRYFGRLYEELGKEPSTDEIMAELIPALGKAIAKGKVLAYVDDSGTLVKVRQATDIPRDFLLDGDVRVYDQGRWPQIVKTNVYGRTLDLTDPKNVPADLRDALKGTNYRPWEDTLPNYNHEYVPVLIEYAAEKGYGKIKVRDTWESDFSSTIALKDFIGYNADPHKAFVERALAGGRPVPPQVLADYPDLARQAPEVAPGTTTPLAGAVQPAGAGAPPKPPPPASVAAAPGPEGKPPAPREGFAGNIRLSKYPEELRPELQAVYDADPAKFEAARRGVRSDEQVRQDAAALIDSVGGNGAKAVRKWQPGQAWNAEEVLALREVLASRTRGVLETQRATREGGDSTANLLRLRLAMEQQRVAQEAVAGVTAEAGRALHQFRQGVEGVLASGDEARLRHLLDRLGGRQNAEEMAAALAKVDMGDQEAVYRFVRNSLKPKAGDYVTEIFYNSILSGPKTHIVNAIGNTLATVISPVERGAAALAELPLARLQGRPAERFMGEVPADAVGALRGIPEGVQKALYILKNGYSWDDVAKLEVRRPQAFKGKVGAVINLPSRALAAADAMSRAINYSAALNAGAYRMARRGGLKGEALATRIAELLADPPRPLMDEGGRLAAYRVFQQEPGKATQALVRLREETGTGQMKPLRYLIPFLQTPANLLKYGLERSPLGILNPKLYSNLAKKSPEAADQIARWLVGSSIAAAIAVYAGQGKITGAAPTSARERDAFYREGKQPFSIKIGDRWIQYSRLEPFNQPLAQVATVVEAIKSGERPDADMVTAALGSIGQNFVSQTYMSGLSDLMNAIQDPERYAGNIAERLGVAMAVPFSAATRTAAQLGDRTIRRPVGLGEEIQAAVPGLSQNVPARLNVWGEDVQRETPPWLPINISAERAGPVDKELSRLGVAVGFVGDSIRSVKLTREQQHDYQRLAGKVVKARLEAIVGNDLYERQTDDTKAKLLERVIRQERDRARETYLFYLIEQRLRERAARR